MKIANKQVAYKYEAKKNKTNNSQKKKHFVRREESLLYETTIDVKIPVFMAMEL